MANESQFRTEVENTSKTVIIPSQVGYANNSIPSFNSNESRVDFARTRDINLPGYLQIGDVEFIVPPQAISVQRESKNESVRTLRSKGSVKTKTGFSDITIEIELYFHNRDAINGYAVEALDGSGYWYINGLRPLIAQFKKTPFLPIKNEDINNIHQIEAVTLKNMTAQTVPGFPDCILVNLTLLKFEYSSFLSFAPDFYDAINWKLFRWFYQRNLNPANKDLIDRTYLEEYTDSNHDVVFSIANEEDLKTVRDKINQIRMAPTPAERLAKMKNKSTYTGQIITVAEELEMSKLGVDARITNRAEYEFGYTPTDEQLATDPNTVVLSFLPDIIEEIAKEEGYKKTSLGWVLDVNSDTIKAVENSYERILQIQKDNETSYAADQEYIHNAEQHIGFITKKIEGLHIQSVVVALDNIISNFQVQQKESPSHQFLGSGDTYIELKIRTNNEYAVAELVDLVRSAEELVRNYRIGIASGFLAIENSLVKLFGVKFVIVNALNIDTVRNQPGLYDITMVLIGFDRNQRDSEQLKIINSSENIKTVQDIKRSYGIENMVVEQKMLELELYPDLELPTQTELQDFCKLTGIKYPYEAALRNVCEYTNLPIPLGKYVDPDFYVHTPDTMRNIMYQQLQTTVKDANEGKSAMNLIDIYTPDGDGGAQIKIPKEGDNTETYFPFTMSDGLYKSYKDVEDQVKGIIDNVNQKQTESTTSSSSNDDTYVDDTVVEEATKTTSTTNQQSFFANSLGLNPSSSFTSINFRPSGPEVSIPSWNGTSEKTIIGSTSVQPADNTTLDEKLDFTVKLKLLKAKQKGSKSQREFILRLVDGAILGWKEYGVFPSVTIGQIIQEQGWDARPEMTYYNICGIKADTEWVKAGKPWFESYTREEGIGRIKAKFRKYSSEAECIRDHGRFLQGASYVNAGAFSALNWLDQLKAIKAGNYATDANYVSSVSNHIEYYELWKYDDLVKYDSNGIPRTAYAEEMAIPEISNNDAQLNLYKLWQDSLIDTLETDQRGRLLRAFPTFQMLLIDEGKWFSWVKMWDNFYGFNAIQSIDVVKSRKIAADTCLISMTNIYQSLTDMDINSDRENIYSQQYEWHDLLFKNFDNTSLIEARKEKITTLMLQTGARLHLRMGYGSNAVNLPTIFNGTITEVEFGDDTIDLVAQGDGIELGNALSAQRDATNNGEMDYEARQTLCYALCSYKNIIKQFINLEMSEEQREPNFWDLVFTKEMNPNGVAHFGNPIIFPNGIDPSLFFQDVREKSIGDAGLNIYTSASTGSKSEWSYDEGDFFTKYDSKLVGQGMGTSAYKKWGLIPWPAGDQANIKMSLYNKSIWDIAKTLTLVAPDYVSTILPFEFRSTLYYGKPYWSYFYKYIYKYDWRPEVALWERSSAYKTPLSKPMSQSHIYMSFTDIILNRIKASEEGVKTNVIATFQDGETSDVISADTDIYPEKQKTAIVNIDIKAPDQKTKNVIAAQCLRDFMKDMYKGNLIVVGDPSVKPYDHIYINDIPNQMYGMTGVKQVVHHMNLSNGYTTDITPDALVLVDDSIYLNYLNLQGSILLGTAGASLAAISSVLLWKKIKGINFIPNSVKTGAATARDFAVDRLLKYAELGERGLSAEEITKLKQLSTALQGSEKAKAATLGRYMDNIIKAKQTATTLDNVGDMSKTARIAYKTANTAFNVGRLLTSATMIGIIAEVGMTILAASALDAYSRFKNSRQAVIILPLTYKNYPLTAGINGHMGCVIGDKPGKIDAFWSGDTGGISGVFVDIANYLSGNEKQYSYGGE